MTIVLAAFLTGAVVSFLWERDKASWVKERKELMRRIAEPQQVIVENAPKREKPERVWSDAQYLKLQQDRGQVPRDN